MKHSLCASNIKSLLVSGYKKRSNHLVCFAFPSNSLKIGFALGRWCGSAVERNKFKRQARTTIRSFQDKKGPLHVLVQPKTKINNIESVQAELLNVLPFFHKTKKVKPL